MAASLMELPSLPASPFDFVEYVNKHPKTQAGVAEAVEPFKVFESKLREVYAQQPTHPAATANHLVPVFNDKPVTLRARNVAKETPADKEQYLLSLPDDARRSDGSLATVKSIKEFKTNFNLFSESSLVDLDWSNVVCAGSAVVTSLLPVGAPHNESKRALRTYYHETLAPASDVDLFLYGLNEEQAVEKIKQIETKIRDSILAETTTIRTKNAITIVSEYPTRHVQIVLRLYKSISEILTGFDVDCSGVAFDGDQVWASPRALAAFMTQVNTIDLTRRSPSYENRLSKYSHRGFEVHWPAIDRSRVDPTIFERSFSRVQGLARLLVLEKLPHPNDRDTYLAKRRAERGRPALPWNSRFRHELPGNVKDAQPDDVAEWYEEDEVSSYHTITIPYGPRYNAKRVEKLLFTKDLLLNAEWNKPKDREANLHRHPAFFGSVNDVLHDCCGFCPEPTTDEDFAALEEESKIYISGDVSFLKDDPGRQAIGSFNPITDDDWTEMAYVGNTAVLCQAIVDQDLDAVKDWFSSPEVVDVNRRDHTGRTPLQLAAMCSTPDIVHYLIEHGARLVSRLYNGMTALHIAAHRGDVQMVKLILDKSASNEAEEGRKEDTRKEARRAATRNGQDDEVGDKDEDDESGSFESVENSDDGEAGEDDETEGSFVKVERGLESKDEMAEDKDEPDVYDVNVLAWDSPLSPLHLAIIAGHLDMVDLLIDKYGADVLLPVKIMDEYNRKNAKAAILTLVLALQLPLQQANQMIKDLLAHGASGTQADMNHISALHYAVSNAKVLILRTMQAADPSAISKACNFVAVTGYWSQPNVKTPLITALHTGQMAVVEAIIKMGASTRIEFESFAQAYKRTFDRASNDPVEVKKVYLKYVEQPVIVALQNELVDFVHKLVDGGEDVNTLSKDAYQYLEWSYSYYAQGAKSLLDLVRDRIKDLQEFLVPETSEKLQKPEALGADQKYLGFNPGSYSYWTAFHDLRDAKLLHQYQMKEYEQEVARKKSSSEEGSKEKELAVKETLSKLLSLEKKLITKGAKSFFELHKDAKKDENSRRGYYRGGRTANSDPYMTTISFKVSDLTPEKRTDYIKLFEAAWTGDTETVRSLCLASTRPLQVAVTDLRGFSPYSLATLRGHYDLAQLIIEIATIQYQPDNKADQYRYTLGTDNDGESYYSDETGESDESDNLKVLAQLVNDTFTIDDVAAVAENVKSKVSPATMVSWRSPVSRALDASIDQQEIARVFGGSAVPSVYIGDHSDYSWAWLNAALEAHTQSQRQTLIRFAIFNDNIDLLKFVITTETELASQKEDDENLKTAQIAKDDFELAMRLGRVGMLGEMIKTTGFGFPLQKVFQKSGIKLNEKPRYYQGLNVHGKKRQDWAEAGRKGYRSKKADSEVGIPLLTAAIEGNLETTDYFLSDAPLRRYLEFADSFKNDKRIQALAQTEGGIQTALNTWLLTRTDLVLHMAVMSAPHTDGTQATLDFLLDKMPHYLEIRSAEGKTPLHLAFELGRYYAAKKLIEAGANQTVRDNLGRNILHSILDTIPADRTPLLRSILDILDQKLIPSLLLERSSGTESSGCTPIALFLGRITSSSGWEESLKLILSHSNGKDLEKLDGAGDYPLHSIVRRGHQELLKFLVDYRPGLLYWENATGMTVSDVVTTSYLQSQVDHYPTLDNTAERSVAHQPAKDFVSEKRTEEEGTRDKDESARSSEWRMYHLIHSLMAKHPGKRKLVSLHDANEVARRLAVQQQKKNEENRRRELRLKAQGGRADDDDEEEDQNRDQVTDYLDRARSFNGWDEMVWRIKEARETKGQDGEDLETTYIKQFQGPLGTIDDKRENPFFFKEQGFVERLKTFLR